MRNQRGFSLLEVVVVVGVAGVLAAVTVPGMLTALERNRVVTGSELVGATFREARLAAITRNSAFRVRFNCPVDGAVRFLAVTGDASIDNASDRCDMTQPNDGPALYMPDGITFGGDAPPIFEVSGRGEFSAPGFTLPRVLSVSHGDYHRNITIFASGRVRIATN